jgi:hypothetical protein
MASNPSPSSILNRRIKFATVNATNGNVIPEPFRVFGPYAQGVRITRLRLGNKAVIPLTSEMGEGSFFLKLHFPYIVGSNMNMSQTMYVTFCVKNQSYDDGYKDFIQRVPLEYATALNRWIDNGRTPSTSGTIRYRKLSFTAYGEETAQANNAVSFEIRFNYRGANVGGNFPTAPTNGTDFSVNGGGRVTGTGGSSNNPLIAPTNETRTR